METPAHILEEIKLMARADHASRLSPEHNPYPAGSPEARAWTQGWEAEAAREELLDEAVAKLPQYRVKAWIVSGGDAGDPTLRQVRELDRSEWSNYSVTDVRPFDGDRGVVFQSKEARDLFPDLRSVAICIEYESGSSGL